jgi:hypothetical protein
VIRVGLVLLLLALAALGLSARQGLDWSEISTPPPSPLIAFVLSALGVAAILICLHTLRRLVRPVTGMDGPPDAESQRVRWYAYLAGLAVILVTVLFVWAALTQVVPQKPVYSNKYRFGAPGEHGDPSQATPHTSTVLIWLLLGAVAAWIVAARLLAARRTAPASTEEPDTDLDDEPDTTALAGAVAAAEQELAEHGDDTRAAIIAAYRAMEAQLVFSGAARRESDTPTEFLQRAVRTSGVSRGAAGRLTDLFREARFSHHPMAPSARDDAARALARVADDLSAGASERRP